MDNSLGISHHFNAVEGKGGAGGGGGGCGDVCQLQQNIQSTACSLPRRPPPTECIFDLGKSIDTALKGSHVMLQQGCLTQKEVFFVGDRLTAEQLTFSR